MKLSLSPGQVTQLVRELSVYAKIAGSFPSQSTRKGRRKEERREGRKRGEGGGRREGRRKRKPVALSVPA